MEAAECEYDLNRVVELKYGTLMSLQHQLEEVEKKLTDFQKSGLSLHRDEVTDIDIAEMVLQKRVVGQDIAIKSVVAAIRRSRTGNRPIASFMFMGPTGVGKTELAKALAGYLFNTENALVRIDMSKYMEKHSVSRLVGAPQGYVGHEEEDGQLTEVVRRRPYSVVLFDKIEKAHHDVFKILLQLLDDGKLKQVQDRLKQRKKIDLHYTKGAVELLGTVELNPNFGVMPINSVIQQLIESELVMGILRGDFKEGDSIMVDVDESPAAKYLPARKKICVKKMDRFSEAIVDSDWEMINSHFA
ncbi:hypothetical protein LWI28_018596 [Acer negundo]|uniref:Uncharacterized protein n=1 Tax=Acer negundo TaxID=4023 RepID=A0AAD5JA73_ACENE|nr:hypothetical protein LWI28_018596 [Acer negundo]